MTKIDIFYGVPLEACPTEYQIQCAFVEYVEKKYPHYRQLLIHIPNEGKRSWREGKRQKKLGLTRGVPDLFFAMPVINGEMQHYCGLWIEIKTGAGRIRTEQKVFIANMLARGYQAKIVRSVDEAIAVFEEYIR
jgi:hypothetical protein